MGRIIILCIMALLVPIVSNAEQLTAEELYAVFDKNAIADERKYKGKEIVVSGEIDTISTNVAKQPLVTLKAGFLQYISCRFPKESVDQLMSMEKGQQVELKCKVNYKIVTTIHLYDCSVR